MGVGFNLIGVSAVQAMLITKSKSVKAAAEAAIKEAGFFIEGEVKESIAGHRAEPKSVDTGRFLSSPFTEFPKELTAVISTPLEYPIVLELGGVNRAPRYHFRNTAKRNETKVKDFIQEKINDVI